MSKVQYTESHGYALDFKIDIYTICNRHIYLIVTCCWTHVCCCLDITANKIDCVRFILHIKIHFQKVHKSLFFGVQQYKNSCNDRRSASTLSQCWTIKWLWYLTNCKETSFSQCLHIRKNTIEPSPPTNLMS